MVYASWGLGRTVVEGRGQVDRFVVERDYPHRIRRQEIAAKQTLVRPQAGGGEEVEEVPPEDREAATLSEGQIYQLVRWALTLERYFKRPQEIEWAVDQERPMPHPPVPGAAVLQGRNATAAGYL